MKKVLFILICLVLAGCVSSKPTINISNQNIFTLTNPNIKLRIDKAFKYIGEFENEKHNYKNKYYIFTQGPKKFITILVRRIPPASTGYWLPIKFVLGEKGNIRDLGIEKFFGQAWSSKILAVNLFPEEIAFFNSKNISVNKVQIERAFIRNASNKVQVFVVYSESLDVFEKKIQQFYIHKKLTKELTEYTDGLIDRSEKAITFME